MSARELPTEPNTETSPGMPRWVKVVGIVIIVLVLLFVILHFTGNNPFSGGHVPPVEHGAPQQ